jgi:hypothetical protein
MRRRVSEGGRGGERVGEEDVSGGVADGKSREGGGRGGAGLKGLTLIFLLLQRAQASCERRSLRGSAGEDSSPPGLDFLRLRTDPSLLRGV